MRSSARLSGMGNLPEYQRWIVRMLTWSTLAKLDCHSSELAKAMPQRQSNSGVISRTPTTNRCRPEFHPAP